MARPNIRTAQLVLAGAFVSLAAAASAQLVPSAAPTPVWGPNGTAGALARVGNTLFVGGDFDVVGPPTGGFAIAERTDPSVVVGSSGIGTVNRLAADGQGGWFAALAASNGHAATVQHLRADGSRDPAWQPPQFNGGTEVYGLFPGGSRLYVSGSFVSVNGTTRWGVVALDGATGAVLPWVPTTRSGNPVPYLPFVASSDGRLYVSVRSGPQADIVAFDAATGAMLPFAPVSAPTITLAGGLAASPAGLFALADGCGFGGSGFGVCAFDTAGQLTWRWTAPGLLGGISSIWAFGDRVYAALRDRPEVAVLDALSGTRIPWNTPAFAVVTDLEEDGDRVYVAASLGTNNAPITLTALDRTSGAVLDWSPVLGDGILTVEAEGGRVALGGPFRNAGGIRRRNLVAIDLVTGRPVDRTPLTPGPVRALATYGDVVFVSMGSVTPEVFAFSAATGAKYPWGLVPNGYASALAVVGQTLFVGGLFSQLNGQDRSYLAAVDLRTGVLTPWRPDPGFEVNELIASDRTLYAAGLVRASATARGAAYDLAQLERTPFDPPLVYGDGIRYLALASRTRLLSTGGLCVPSCSLPAIRWLDGTTGGVVGDVHLPFASTIAAGLGDTVFVGGVEIPSAVSRVTAIHAPSGRPLGWDLPLVWSLVRGMPPPAPVRALLAETDLVVLAGAIEMAGDAQVSNVAVFRMPPPAAPAGLTRSLSGNTVTLGWRHTGAAAGLAYVVEAGTAPGAVDVGRFPVGERTNVSGGLPDGTYYLRVRSVTAAGDSQPSGEAITTIPAPATPPGAPGTLSASVSGGVVTLTWGAGTGNATSYVIEAGTAAGLTNIGALPTGNLDTTWSVPAPAGTYVVRVRAANAFGLSPATNEVTVVVP